MSTAGFPEPPNGSPGGVRSAASSLEKAGRSFEAVGTGLTGASGAIAADWKGWAASAYMDATQQLQGPVKNAASDFDDCAQAVRRYADLLEETQESIKNLRQQWVAARARQATAAQQLAELGAQLAGAKPKQMAGIVSDMGDAASSAATAGGEAELLVAKANEVLTEFRSDAEAQASVLSGRGPLDATPLPLGSGVSPFGGVTAPAFGLMGGALPAGSDGVIRVNHPNQRVAKGPGEYLLDGGPFAAGENDYKMEPDMYEATNIPGFSGFQAYKTGRSEDALLEDNSLINPVNLASGGLAGLASAPIRGAVGGKLAQGAGLAGTQQAAREAYKKAYDDVIAGMGHHQSMRQVLIEAREAGRLAAAETQLAAHSRQAKAAEALLEGLGKTDVPLPQGASKILPHIIENRTAYHMYTTAKLLGIREHLVQHPGPGSAALIKAIDKALGAG